MTMQVEPDLIFDYADVNCVHLSCKYVCLTSLSPTLVVLFLCCDVNVGNNVTTAIYQNWFNACMSFT